jgi:hypothetical protein
VAWRYEPAAVPLGGRVLAPNCTTLAQEPDSCRRAPRRQGLNAVAAAAGTWATTPDVYLSKILIRPFIFRKSRQINIKKFRVVSLVSFFSFPNIV